MMDFESIGPKASAANLTSACGGAGFLPFRLNIARIGSNIFSFILFDNVCQPNFTFFLNDAIPSNKIFPKSTWSVITLPNSDSYIQRRQGQGHLQQ